MNQPQLLVCIIYNEHRRKSSNSKIFSGKHCNHIKLSTDCCNAQCVLLNRSLCFNSVLAFNSLMFCSLLQPRPVYPNLKISLLFRTAAPSRQNQELSADKLTCQLVFTALKSRRTSGQNLVENWCIFSCAATL